MSMVDEFEAEYPGQNVLEEPFTRFIRWLEDNGQSWRYQTGQVIVTPYIIDSLTDMWSDAAIAPDYEYPDHWFGNDTLRHNVVALAQGDASGGMFVLWRPNGDEHHYIYMGSEGERLYLTDDVVRFMQILTFGLEEFSEYALDEEPNLEGARASREWISAEFGVTYPDSIAELIDPARQAELEAWVEASIR